MNTIVLRDFSLAGATAAEEARASRDHLLELAKALPLVTDAASQAKATDVLRNLRNFYKVIEEGRQTAKAPVIKLERDIDGLARDLSQAVEEEGKRLSAILGAYDMEQKRIVEQKRQEALAQERLIRDQAARAERAAEEERQRVEREAEAERQRQQAAIDAEALAKANRARSEAGRERAVREAEERKAALADKAALDAQERERVAFEEQKARDDEEARRVAATRESALALTASKPKDTSTSEVIKFEVVDIVALYEAAPYLVRLEPNASAIKSALKGLHGEQKLPGVKHWREATTITRG